MQRRFRHKYCMIIVSNFRGVRKLFSTAVYLKSELRLSHSVITCCPGDIVGWFGNWVGTKNWKILLGNWIVKKGMHSTTEVPRLRQICWGSVKSVSLFKHHYVKFFKKPEIRTSDFQASFVTLPKTLLFLYIIKTDILKQGYFRYNNFRFTCWPFYWSCSVLWCCRIYTSFHPSVVLFPLTNL